MSSGLPIQDFGNVTLTLASPTLFTIHDTEFGTFTGDTLKKILNTDGFLNLILEGEWMPGTFNSGLKQCDAGCTAQVRLSFTQTPPTDGEISLSGTMSTTVAAVIPEPPSALLFMSGIGMILLGSRLRRFLIA